MTSHWLNDIRETYPMLKILGETQCCSTGCDDGSCQECPCCHAGWCVYGHEGVPDTAEDYLNWLVVAEAYNPVARLLAGKNDEDDVT